ncbi:hypothetical protein OMP38_22730 [Cohnella ginsengisoli]|uniref:Uncharacterized protein n=1 Tax=Cohnella ginsengisoli TaxID=425004 RepID=A0A9X4KK23_9BACL|nr:hypothetical protein [Cohnella ginsengisoli]MDG0793345.1 hypothetical protein [Cohnella ginsengisoli]
MSKPASQSKSAKGGTKKKAHAEHVQPQMKVVLSDVCAVCKTPCARGIAYLERMMKPGALGKGVPCVLTLPKKG